MKKRSQNQATTPHTETPKKHKKQKKHSSLGNALKRFICFALSLYVLTSVLFTEDSGTFGGIIKNFLMGCFGPIGAIGIPASLVVIFFFGGSLKKANVMGRKTTLSLTAIGAVREVLGSGAIFGYSLGIADYMPLVFVLAPGAFLVLGYLMVLFNKLAKK